jgi:hypothetical protein
MIRSVQFAGKEGAMGTAGQSQAKTRMFARVIGPFLIVITATAIVRADDMRTLPAEFAANPLWSWVTGAFVLLSGLVAVALHQYWRSAAAIIVSVVGWLVVLKGLFLLAFPRAYLSDAETAVEAVGWWRAGFVVLTLIGLYLAYVGWAPASRRPVSSPASAVPDIPHALPGSPSESAHLTLLFEVSGREYSRLTREVNLLR